MKNLKKAFFLALMIAFLFFSCGKEGPQGIPGPQGPAGQNGSQGPAGSQGTQGPAGPKGPQGPAGQTGATGSQGPTGQTGATGPQGPSGQTGATGAQGPAGATGPQGPAGTANVIYSSWITPSWPPPTAGGPRTITASAITEAEINTGTILVYYRSSSTSNLIVLLPFPDPLTNVLVYDEILGPTSDTPATIYIYHNNFTNTEQYRYIIIPGGVSVARQAPPPDYKNYDLVCKYYGIPE